MTDKKITIYHDTKSLISDWAIFLIGITVISIYIYSFIEFIQKMEPLAQLPALIVFMFALVKMLYWIRLPSRHTFTVDDIQEEYE